ncbi:MAG TPA: NUDIX domain-containing protein [Candidatus Limnocylindria bacterium]
MRKVLCYVVRDGRLLVFDHRDHPDAGVQVPAGTLHDGEDPAAGAVRETEEETGHRVPDRREARGVFHLTAPPGLPGSWSHLAEEGNGDFWFAYRWIAITPELTLAGDQHAYLGGLAPHK